MALPEKEKYTFVDFLANDKRDRIEIINGNTIMISPPTSKHQEILMELSRQIANFLEGKSCKVFPAPFEVRLLEQDKEKPEDVDTVAEPDVTAICNKNKIDKHGCKGAPDMVIEIISPSTRRHDRLVKLNLYQRAEVGEYWIVDPLSESVTVYLRDDNGNFKIHEDYGRTDIAKVHSLDGCFIELQKVFPE